MKPKNYGKDISSVNTPVKFHLPDGSTQLFNNSQEAQAWFNENYSDGYSMTEYIPTQGDSDHPIQLPEITVTAQAPKKSLSSPPTRRGVDMWIGANYSPRFNKYFYGTSDFDALFGKSRVEGVKKAWQSNPEYMQKAWTDTGNEIGAVASLPIIGGLYGASPVFAGAMNLMGAYQGLGRLTSEEGIAKTVSKVQEGDWGGAARSFGGDVLDITMSLPFLNRVRQIARQSLGNWRPFLPYNSNRYYRIVGNAENPNGDAILDANNTGVIRSRATGRGMSFTTPDGQVHSIGKMGFDYPMFSRGSIWKGSTNGTGRNYRVIRSKADTGPIKWEQSNVDFRHKGHNGIYRPSLYGQQNVAPAEYFEYWEPARFGWRRKDFTPFSNPKNLGSFSDYPESAPGLGKYLGDGGSGEEAVVFDSGDGRVFKVLTNPDFSSTPIRPLNFTYGQEQARALQTGYINPRNQHQLFEPLTFEGVVSDSKGLKYPVVSQRRLQTVANSTGAPAENPTAVTQEIEQSLFGQGYVPKLSPSGNKGYANQYGHIYDLHEYNLGRDNQGNLKIFDMLVGK